MKARRNNDPILNDRTNDPTHKKTLNIENGAEKSIDIWGLLRGVHNDWVCGL